MTIQSINQRLIKKLQDLTIDEFYIHPPIRELWMEFARLTKTDITEIRINTMENYLSLYKRQLYKKSSEIESEIRKLERDSESASYTFGKRKEPDPSLSDAWTDYKSLVEKKEGLESSITKIREKNRYGPYGSELENLKTLESQIADINEQIQRIYSAKSVNGLSLDTFFSGLISDLKRKHKRLSKLYDQTDKEASPLLTKLLQHSYALYKSGANLIHELDYLSSYTDCTCYIPGDWRKILADLFKDPVPHFTGRLLRPEHILAGSSDVVSYLVAHKDDIDIDDARMTATFLLLRTSIQAGVAATTANNVLHLPLSGCLMAKVRFRKAPRNVPLSHSSYYLNAMLNGKDTCEFKIFNHAWMESLVGFYILTPEHVVDITFQGTPMLSDLSTFHALAALLSHPSVLNNASAWDDDDSQNNNYRGDEYDGYPPGSDPTDGWKNND